MRNYKLYVLGARGTHSVSGEEYSVFGGRTSCYILKRDDHAIVLDAGTGLYNAKEILSDCTQVDIVLSHLHYDHIIGLLKPVYPQGCTVNIYAELEKWGGLDTLMPFLKSPFWPVGPLGITSFIDVKERVELVDGVYLQMFEGCHPDYASISRIDFWNDFGFCFATDFEHLIEFPPEAIDGCRYLMYDGTYTSEEYSKYKGWGHSDWKHGYEIAKKYGVELLMIIHHDPMKDDETLLKIEKQAQQVSKNIIFTREGFEFELGGDFYMSQEVESLWGAMKDVHYTRTLKLLKNSLRDARNLEASLSVSLDTIVEAVHAVSGTFWFYERYRDGRIYPKSVYGGGNLGNVSLLPGEGIAGGVIQTGEAIIVYDCQNDPRWQGKVDDKTGFKTESMICVPLISENNVFGCIQIINKENDSYFDDSDLEFTKGLAENSSQLFEDNGMLEDYYSGRAREEQAQREITFMQIMGAHNIAEMEFQLRRIEQFSKLRVKEQDEVLSLAKNMYAYFGSVSKKTGFGRFLGRK